MFGLPGDVTVATPDDGVASSGDWLVRPLVVANHSFFLLEQPLYKLLEFVLSNPDLRVLPANVHSSELWGV